jgi:hypothetical protein
VTPKADATAMDAMVKDDQLLDKKEELTSIIDRKTRRDKCQVSCRANAFPLPNLQGLFAIFMLWD